MLKVAMKLGDCSLRLKDWKFLTPLLDHDQPSTALPVAGLFVTICVPAAAFANRGSVLILCQLSFILHALVRAFKDAEEFEKATDCISTEHP